MTIVEERRLERFVADAGVTVFLLGTDISADSALTEAADPRAFLVVEEDGTDVEALDDGFRVRGLGASSGSKSSSSVSREGRDFFLTGAGASSSSSSCTSSNDLRERVEARPFVVDG